MPLLTLPYPVKPYGINRAWGVLVIDPKTGQSVYKPFGFLTHNGVDFPYGEDTQVHCEIPGWVYRTGYQPTGGGIFLSVLSDVEYTFPDGVTCFVLIDYLHAEELLVHAGDKIALGQPVIIPDSTGFVTGPHTHGQYRRVKKVTDGLQNVDKNDANNSFNPELYRNGTYAQDFYNVGAEFKHFFAQRILYKEHGNEVIKLQTAMNVDVGAKLPLTGYYGDLTRAAVQKFQLKYKVAPIPECDGRSVGPKTRSALNLIFNK